MTNKPALCQCIKCFKYLSHNRLDDGSYLNDFCEDCVVGGIPLANIRGTLTDPLSIECLALLSEECAETQQRVGKVQRWGWEADFEGTTQRHKLETEIGDILASICIGLENGIITTSGLQRAMDNKLAKLREDANGPRQRLLHAKVPKKYNGGGYHADWIGFLPNRPL